MNQPTNQEVLAALQTVAADGVRLGELVQEIANRLVSAQLNLAKVMLMLQKQ